MFCSCGAFLFFPTLISDPISCKRCMKDNSNFQNILASSPKISTTANFSFKEEAAEVAVKGAKITMECPSCGNNEMNYSTAQLRSADEGQTVFYACENCGYKETVNS